MGALEVREREWMVMVCNELEAFFDLGCTVRVEEHHDIMSFVIRVIMDNGQFFSTMVPDLEPTTLQPAAHKLMEAICDEYTGGDHEVHSPF